MVFSGSSGEYFEVVDIHLDHVHLLHEVKESQLTLLWFSSNSSQLIIDSVTYNPSKDDIMFLTEFHQIQAIEPGHFKMLRFNRPFYCILDHDSEVGCKGVLYYGASQVPMIQITEDDLNILKAVWDMLVIEMQSRDNLQQEMLQMMLKRILILCTRIYKKQNKLDQQKEGQFDLVREFNFLVEKHFRTMHNVSQYADLLNRAPKTLSNLFRKTHGKSPLQFISERRMLEARRLLRHSDLQVSEIGYDLGFIDVQSFSRFFKKHEGITPMHFRNHN